MRVGKRDGRWRKPVPDSATRDERFEREAVEGRIPAGVAISLAGRRRRGRGRRRAGALVGLVQILLDVCGSREGFGQRPLEGSSQRLAVTRRTFARRPPPTQQILPARVCGEVAWGGAGLPVKLPSGTALTSPHERRCRLAYCPSRTTMICIVQGAGAPAPASLVLALRPVSRRPSPCCAGKTRPV